MRHLDHNSVETQRCSVAERLTIRLQNGVRRCEVKLWHGKWTRTAREETVFAEDCYGIYEEQADVKYASQEKHD
jgi:hypothetical protein